MLYLRPQRRRPCALEAQAPVRRQLPHRQGRRIFTDSHDDIVAPAEGPSAAGIAGLLVTAGFVPLPPPLPADVGGGRGGQPSAGPGGGAAAGEPAADGAAGRCRCRVPAGGGHRAT